jgi:murein L,D-transpeptidase YcbB/YkuD
VENFKFIIISLISLVLVSTLGYWAFMTIEPGDVHVYKQKYDDLKVSNAALEKEVADLKDRLALRESATPPTPAPEPTPVVTPTPKPTVKPAPKPATLKYQSLIDALQKLVDGNVFMKVGSQGTRVGTLETFLNIYNKTSKKVDNDYGASLKTDIVSFQKAVGIAADGETGPTTYMKMITWLKKQ